MISNKFLWGIVASGGTVGGLTGVGIGVKNLVAWENLKKEESEILWEYVELGGTEKKCYVHYKGKQEKEEISNEKCRNWTSGFEVNKTIGEKVWLRVEKDLLKNALEKENLIGENEEIKESWNNRGMVCEKEELYGLNKYLVKCESKAIEPSLPEN
ncbi:hypothetical protein MSUIS_05260 [Mycoplasma suis KI3806]|uniref:Uncharacterized protein n=1 Tax=Mycoplasma suis (strain KI_3806) TaxID=708248 RepID=F0V1T8_MYCS3|nr:hypothetical protein [Mycoplasma suis]CBZ40619.1 hypothetical protein MSUIS_05260 [Mycoplasma suis KI3806]